MMKHKEYSDFTESERNWMDTVSINYIIAQSDGFQLGYATAISDLTEMIVDYWQCSDEKPQQSILDTLVDLGVNLGKRKRVAEKNVEIAKDNGYEQYYVWECKATDRPFNPNVPLFTKDFEQQKEPKGEE